MKITATQLDLLVQSIERPEPVPLRRNLLGAPICPMISTADWSQSVSLTSRWLTDVTKPIGGKRQAMVLSSRPVRSQTISVVVDSKQKASELLLALLEFSTYSGNPVPLFCDGALVASVNGLLSTAQGTFTHRRFFPGGRILFLGLSAHTYATVVEVGPSELRYEVDSGATRLPEAGDYVFPCMDSELVTDSSISARTDSVHVASVTWNELEGISCLPAIWPSISPDDGSNALPIAQVIDNKPVFNLEPDWSESPEIGISREFSTDAGSRGGVIETKGDAFLTFSFSLMGYERSRTWKILRWFDLMRGRAGSFWLIHPSKPWAPASSISTSSFTLPSFGSSLSAIRHVRRAAFIRASGEVEIRSISAVSDVGGLSFSLSTPLPDTDFVDIQPVYLVSFDSDAITETWATDTVVPSISLSMTEQPEHGVVSFVSSMGYREGFPGLYGIPGMSFLIRAGVECYSADGRPSSVWPSNNFVAYEWRDLSTGPKRSFERVGVQKKLISLNTALAPLSALCRFPANESNNGQAVVFSPNYTIPHLFDPLIQEGDKHLWGPDGFTIFLAITPQEHLPSATDLELFHINAAGVGIRFFYDRAGQSGAARHALQVRSAGTWNTLPLTVAIDDKETSCCLAIHIDNLAAKARVWLNGTKAAAASLSCVLPVPSAVYDFGRFFSAYDTGLPVSSSRLQQGFLKWGAVSMVTCFSRPLDEAEMNLVLKSMSDSFKTPANPITFYA